MRIMQRQKIYSNTQMKFSAFVSAILTAAAAYKYVNGKIKKAYKYFEQSLLVNIFIGQVVLFFKSQAIALVWLAITLLLLINLELLSAERSRKRPVNKAPID